MPSTSGGIEAIRLPRKLTEYMRLYDRETGGYLPQGARPNSTSNMDRDYASVEVEVGMLWSSLVLLLRPAQVLETGTYLGFSTSCIAAALRALGGERQIVSIDPEPREHLWLGTPLARLVQYIPKFSQEAAADVAGRSFDMLVLDSDHHYGTIMAELAIFEPILRDGGTILMHDSLYYDGVGLAVKQLRENPRFECVTLDTPRTHGVKGCRPPGVTIVRKARSGAPVLQVDPALVKVNVGNRLSPPVLRTQSDRPSIQSL